MLLQYNLRNIDKLNLKVIQFRATISLTNLIWLFLSRSSPWLWPSPYCHSKLIVVTVLAENIGIHCCKASEDVKLSKTLCATETVNKKRYFHYKLPMKIGIFLFSLPRSMKSSNWCYNSFSLKDTCFTFGAFAIRLRWRCQRPSYWSCPSKNPKLNIITLSTVDTIISGIVEIVAIQFPCTIGTL